MKKEIEETNYNTEFHKKIITDLLKKGVSTPSYTEIAFLSENDSDDICVDYKGMSTGLHYNKKDINEEDVFEAGFKWWPTWNFKN